MREYDVQEIRSALRYIDDSDRQIWFRIASALKSYFNYEGQAIFEEWSKEGTGYNKSSCRATWKSAKATGEIGIGQIIYRAKQEGWIDKASRMNEEEAERRARERAIRAIEEERKEAEKYLKAGITAERILKESVSARRGHPYLKKKGINSDCSLLETSRDYTIFNGKDVRIKKGVLVIPVLVEGHVSSCQFIGEDGFKLFLPCARARGGYGIIEGTTDQSVGICEGYATGVSINEEMGEKVYIGFNDFGMIAIADFVRKLHPDLIINVYADNDREKKNRKNPYQKWVNAGVVAGRMCARSVGGYLHIPDFSEYKDSNGTDFNDLAQLGKTIKSTLIANNIVIETKGSLTERQERVQMLNDNKMKLEASIGIRSEVAFLVDSFLLSDFSIDVFPAPRVKLKGENKCDSRKTYRRKLINVKGRGEVWICSEVYADYEYIKSRSGRAGRGRDYKDKSNEEKIIMFLTYLKSIRISSSDLMNDKIFNEVAEYVSELRRQYVCLM